MAMTKEERGEYNRKWRAENVEKIKAKKAKYRAENAEKIKSYRAKWGAENAEKVKASQAKWNAENPEKIKASQAEWFAKNAEKEKARRAKSIAELKDGYVEEMLRRQGFPKESITPELIELKRITLKTSRLCRQLKN